MVEPYYGGSHRSWADGLVEHSQHEVHVVAHDPNFWRWRLRGAAVTLAEITADVVAKVGQPDVLLVSDFVNLPAYLGLTRRVVGDPAVALYMHENQLSYPLGPSQQPDEALSLVNWVSMVAADHVFFNSQFHLDELFGELATLLKRAPDAGHIHLLDSVREKSSVLPVGVTLGDIGDQPRTTDGPPLILWSHRWDHDKNPRAVFGALDQLAAAGYDFRFALAGENERVDPREFHEAIERLGDRVIHHGFLDRQAYVALLATSDIVVSAVHHEFFGIAMVEAMVAGAIGVLPNRLSYPEIVPEQFHDVVLYDEGGFVDRLRDVLDNLDHYRQRTVGLSNDLRRYDWATLVTDYDTALGNLRA